METSIFVHQGPTTTTWPSVLPSQRLNYPKWTSHFQRSHWATRSAGQVGIPTIVPTVVFAHNFRIAWTKINALALKIIGSLPFKGRTIPMSSNLEKVQHKIIVRKISSQTGGLDPLKPRALKDLQAPERAGGRLKLTNPTGVRRKLQPELAQVLQIYSLDRKSVV